MYSQTVLKRILEFKMGKEEDWVRPFSHLKGGKMENFEILMMQCIQSHILTLKGARSQNLCLNMLQDDCNQTYGRNEFFEKIQFFAIFDYGNSNDEIYTVKLAKIDHYSSQIEPLKSNKNKISSNNMSMWASERQNGEDQK